MRASGQDLRAGMAGDQIAELHGVLLRLGYTLPDTERRDQRFGTATAQAVAAFQKAQGLWDTAVVDQDTAAAFARALGDAGEETMMIPLPQPAATPVPVPPQPGNEVPLPPGDGPFPGDGPPGTGGGTPPRPEPPATLTGTAYLEYGGPAADVSLRLYQRGFGGLTRALKETSTRGDGTFEFTYHLGGEPANLEVRAIRPGGEEVSLTLTAFSVADGDVLNVVVPTVVRPPAPEYQRLLFDVTPHLSGQRLGVAKENTEQPDLTLLQEITAWDARLVALAASADRVADLAGMSPPAAYALARAGFPTDAAGLAGISPATVARSLDEAIASGVVALDKEDRRAAVEAFEAFAVTTRLAAIAPGTLSSQAELLAAAGLSANDAARFDEIYSAHSHSGAATEELWQQVEAAGLPVDALRLTGKLGLLTLNNATLIRALQPEVSGALGPALVGGRLYRAEEWVRRLTTIAKGDDDALAALVPPAYAGETTEARVRAYAQHMARKVRVGYSTAVIGDQVATGHLVITTDAVAQADTAGFLNRAEGLGLGLGRTPVTAMVRDHGEQLLAGVPADRVAAVTENVRTLQRVYQITPTDDAMKVLLDNGFRSAYDVTGMSHAKFLKHHGVRFATQDEASLVYRKSQQVSSVSQAVLVAAKQLDTTPALYAMRAADTQRQSARTELIEHFPTMEELFGSLDYCECDHCRSVLSPAAYFVDLLHFLDPPADEWATELALWQGEHGAPYPFVDAPARQDFLDQWAAEHPMRPAPDTGLSPYEALVQRRPDLTQLPLTCENTDTVLPYLDVVNEILEFYVAHGRLGPAAVRDTGDALTADLLAEPQYIISQAYDRLRTAAYPIGLPFDLWLETVRRLLDHFETPLWTVLDAFRRTDALYSTGTASYGQAAVAIERLGLSRAEYALLVHPNPSAHWHEWYGYPAGAQATATTELANAVTLARSLGVSYEELLELVTTGFVNPRLYRIAALPKLGIGLADVLRYQGVAGHAPFSPQEQADFEALLAPVGGPAAVAGLWQPEELSQILVLADASGDCGFETTTLQYADGTPADAIAFLSLTYLVRLWRRLGWTLADTDRALSVFLPSDPDPRTGATLGPAMGSALLGVSGLDALYADLGGDRAQLLELWSDLTATRYEELFLVPGTPAVDPVFDEPLGRYLQAPVDGGYQPYTWDPTRPESATDGNVGLAAHLGTVQAALQLSADDVSRILADAETTVEAAPLDMATVSLLHRYALLARRLRLPVADLIALRQIGGYAPFEPPQPGPVTTLAEDHAQATASFVEAVRAVQAQSMSVADVDYLLRYRYDPAGPYATIAAAPLSLVRTLDAEITRINTEHADPADATALSDEELRQKMALVLAADAVERFFGMWTGTITYDAVTVGVDPADQLDPASVATEPAVTLYYDELRAEQHLVYRGVLVESERRRLVGAFAGSADAKARYAELLTSAQTTAREFFDLNLVMPIGFLNPADYDLFFTPPATGADEATLQAELAAKRQRLVSAFLPFLRDRLIDAAVLAIVGAEFPDAAELVTPLVTEAELLTDRLWPDDALLTGFRAAGERGITADTTTGSVDVYIEIPTAGSYRFFVSAPTAGTAVDLSIDGFTEPLLMLTTAADGEEPSASADLAPGLLYHLVLTCTGTAPVTLLVQGENLPKGPLERLTSHPADQVERVRRAQVLLDKAIRLATGTGLTEPELRHLLTHPADFSGLTLSALPVTPAEDVAEQAVALFGQLLRLLDHAALRNEIGAVAGELTDLFAHARRAYPLETGPTGAEADLLADLQARVAILTRRDIATVAAAADQVGLAVTATVAGDAVRAVAPMLADERGLRRLWTVLALVGRLGVTPDILATTATVTPDMTVARQLRDAVRACYDAATWRRVAQPIFDVLRQRRRDALVAWIMHADGFDRIEQLYEYFLVDPGTEPVVQTSRLRLATSAVQLFIQRCLLNLEPAVHPSAIDSDHWQWMKRYRVWEANRKIFLWPENFLEPEFRDDKTHLYQALEGTLFAGDVTDDLAEDAFLAYLRSLEALARLDIRAEFLEEKPDPADNTLHVVGRTYGKPHRYFYRTYSYGAWTPWIPVTAEIDGDNVMAVVWRDRPHLFWVTFIDKAERSTEHRKPSELAEEPSDDLLGARIVDAQLHWTELFQGEWGDPESTAPSDLASAAVSSFWVPASERVHVSLSGDAVLIHLNGTFDTALRVESKNSTPVTATVEAGPIVPYPQFDPNPSRGPRRLLPLAVSYADRITTWGTGLTEEHQVTVQILNQGTNFDLCTVDSPPADPETGMLTSPFFYKDSAHTFFIEPSLFEMSLDDWDGWVIDPITPQLDLDRDDYWDRLGLTGQGPTPRGSELTDPIAAVARYQIQPRTDWATQPGATVGYEGGLVHGFSSEGD